MPQSSGSPEPTEMRPHDQSGKYWSSPPCRVRVDDGKRTSWIDLKRPYALIGSHPCCTLRIRGGHVPDVAYFVCCFRDRVEIWPTAAIAFPRWGVIRSDVSVLVGTFSLTFHLDGESAQQEHVTYRADAEIETRLAWPGQDFERPFRLPVTIIGDNHPSVLRLHGRGLIDCNYAAVVQNKSFWLVDLSARRMQRSERVHRMDHRGDRFQLGDATLEFVTAKPLLNLESAVDNGIGLGIVDDGEVDDGDLHSDPHDIHSDEGHSGFSGMHSGILSPDADPSISFIARKSGEKNPQRPETRSEPPAATEPAGNRRERSRKRTQDGDEPELCLSESLPAHSRFVGEEELDQQTKLKREGESPSRVVKPDPDTCRYDGPKSGVSAPKLSPDGQTKNRSEHDESSTVAALSLVDTAMGLVDAAVKESDADQPSCNPPTPNSPVSPLVPDESEEDPLSAGEVCLSSHDPPLLVDRTAAARQDDTQAIDLALVESLFEPEREFDHFPDQQEGRWEDTDLQPEPPQRDLPSQVEAEDRAPLVTDPAISDPYATATPLQTRQMLELAIPIPTISTPSVPTPVVSEQTVSEPTVSEPTVSEPTVSEPTVSEQTVSEQTVSEQTVSEQAVSEQAVSEQAVSEQAVSEQAVAEQTVSEQAVAEQTVAEQAVAEPTEASTPIVLASLREVPRLAERPLARDLAADRPAKAKGLPGELSHSESEALTNRITTRLSEIGERRSILGQIVLWTVITAAIVVPAVVATGVIRRIYLGVWY